MGGKQNRLLLLPKARPARIPCGRKRPNPTGTPNPGIKIQGALRRRRHNLRRVRRGHVTAQRGLCLQARAAPAAFEGPASGLRGWESDEEINRPPISICKKYDPGDWNAEEATSPPQRGLNGCQEGKGEKGGKRDQGENGGAGEQTPPFQIQIHISSVLEKWARSVQTGGLEGLGGFGVGGGGERVRV